MAGSKRLWFLSQNAAGAQTACRDCAESLGPTAGLFACNFPPAQVGEEFTDADGTYFPTGEVEEFLESSDNTVSEFWAAMVPGGPGHAEKVISAARMDDGRYCVSARYQGGTLAFQYRFRTVSLRYLCTLETTPDDEP